MIQNLKNSLPIKNIKEIHSVSGGDVNDAYKVTTSESTYFLLIQKNHSEKFFAAEIAGLHAFKEAGVRVPEVINSGEIDGDAFLILSYLREGTEGSQQALGEMVAELHLNHQPDGRFGFHLPSDFEDIEFNNDWTETWTEIFIERRLDVLKDLILQKGIWQKSDLEIYNSVRSVIIDSLQNHQSEPSLLHGDLWGGNYMFLTDGTPALFDPAPLFGDREFDLGATKVFGGFTDEFYEMYHKVYPLQDGADIRIVFYEFYMLLLHLAKFGTVYKAAVSRIMKEILSNQ